MSERRTNDVIIGSILLGLVIVGLYGRMRENAGNISNPAPITEPSMPDTNPPTPEERQQFQRPQEAIQVPEDSSRVEFDNCGTLFDGTQTSGSYTLADGILIITLGDPQNQNFEVKPGYTFEQVVQECSESEPQYIK